MNQSKKINTKELVLAAMMTAILVVLSQISIPLPSGVPITLQTFGVALCGYMLGCRLGTVSVLVYVILGAVGAPVFAGMQGGAAILFGKTGGFIWGFITMSFLCGLAVKCKRKILSILLGICGLITTHILGVLFFTVLTNMPWNEAFVIVSLPYIIKDIISVICAAVLAAILRKNLMSEGIYIINKKEM